MSRVLSFWFKDNGRVARLALEATLPPIGAFVELLWGEIFVLAW